MRSALKPPVRYPLALALRYHTKSENAVVSGTSATKWIGSRQIAFGANEDIQPRMKIQLSIAWPLLLENRVRLQLSVEALVTNVAAGLAEAVILRYDFRTRKEHEPAACNHLSLPAVAIPFRREMAAGAAAHS